MEDENAINEIESPSKQEVLGEENNWFLKPRNFKILTYWLGILVITISLIAVFYVWHNLELIKADPCQLCYNTANIIP